MKIEVRNVERENHRLFQIKIDGESVFGVGDGEPEDNTLNRNFNDCINIPYLLRMCYFRGIKDGKDGIGSVQIETTYKDPDE